jgi:hypothetical protein
MSHLSALPECEKSSGAAVSLGEVFSAKEYLAEIKGALKKGYTFDDLAEIFTEKCGVKISARRIKHHFTRAKNSAAKGKSGKKKAGETDTSGDCVSSGDSQLTGAAGRAQENPDASESDLESFSKFSGFSFEKRAISGVKRNVDTDAFSLDTRPKES